MACVSTKFNFQPSSALIFKAIFCTPRSFSLFPQHNGAASYQKMKTFLALRIVCCISLETGYLYIIKRFLAPLIRDKQKNPTTHERNSLSHPIHHCFSFFQMTALRLLKRKIFMLMHSDSLFSSTQCRWSEFLQLCQRSNETRPHKSAAENKKVLGSAGI